MTSPEPPVCSHRRLIVTTSWDDGHPLDLRIAEMLHKHGLQGTFYVPVRHRFPLLTSAQVRELSNAFEIGGHTVTHCDLLAVSEEVAYREIAECRDTLNQTTGQSCTSFCFPKGRFQLRHLDAVREAGYTLARTVEMMSFSLPQRQRGIRVAPTTMQAAPFHWATLAKNALKRRPANLINYLFSRRQDWQGTAAALLDRAGQRGGVFHLWGHSWEIEQHAFWQDLERLFSILATFRSNALFVRNGDLGCAHPAELPVAHSRERSSS